MQSRPQIPMPKTKQEWLLDVLSIAALVLTAAYLFITWPDIPDRVPIHFNFAGEPDGWGHKAMIPVLLALGVLMFSGLTLLRKIPHRFNYPVQITERNAERSYRLSIQLLSWMKLEISLLFSGLLWEMTHAALGYENGIGQWLMPAALIGIFGTLIYYFARIVKQ